MKKKGIVFLIVVLLTIILFSLISVGEKHIPSGVFRSPELISPGDWIKEEQIKVYKDKVVIDLKNPSWATFTNTNSMDPILDEKSHAIEIKPESGDEIEVGDVISYQTEYGIIIHRVIEKGKDEEGIYYMVKGDNNQFEDPFKVRFENVKGVVVALIY